MLPDLDARIRRIILTLLWPLRRFFDPRFVSLGRMVETVDHRVGRLEAELTRLTADVEEQGAVFGPLVAGAVPTLAGVEERLGHVEALLGEMLREDAQAQARQLVGAPIDVVGGGFAELLDFADSAGGFRARAGLWYFPGVRVRYGDGAVALAGLEPAFVSVPFAHRALSTLRPGDRVLDLSPADALVAPTLAALGMRCDRLGAAGGPLLAAAGSRPAATLVEPGEGEPYRAVVCLDGLDAIEAAPAPGEDPRAAALRRLATLAAPGTRVVSVEDGGDDLAWAERDGWTVVERFPVRVGPNGLWEAAVDSDAALQLLTLECTRAV